MQVAWSGWTEEVLERCKAMWREDRPASAIGSEIGATRNMVIAKMNRLGLSKSALRREASGRDAHPVEVPVEVPVGSSSERVMPNDSNPTDNNPVEPVSEPVRPDPTYDPSEEARAVDASPDEASPEQVVEPEPDADPDPIVEETVPDEAIAEEPVVSETTDGASEPASEPSMEPPMERLDRAFDAALAVPSPVAPSPVAKPPEPSPAGEEGVLFFDIRDSQCKFPLWDFNNTVPIHEKRFCGRRRLGTLSWCKDHLPVIADEQRMKKIGRRR